MKTLRAILLLLPLVASAEWRQLTPGFPGLLKDVQVVDAGVVLAVSSSAATAFLAGDGGTLVTMSGDFVGAGLYGPNCLLGLQSLGTIVGSAGCPGGPTLAGGTPVRFRLLRPSPFGLAVMNSASFDQLFAGPQADGGWSAQGGTWLGAGDRALQASVIDGVEYAAMNGSGFLARVSVDGGASFQVNFPNPLRDVSPFARLGAPALLGVGAATGLLYLVPDLRAPVAASVSSPTGVSARFASLEQGVGMATSVSGVVLSPIPDPARPGELWVVRSGAPLLTERIDCTQTGWCASVTSGGAVWSYQNVASPSLTVPPISVDAGQPVRLSATATDTDGDPTFVSWSADAGVSFTPVGGIDDGRQVELLVQSGAACGLNSIEVTVRDGLPGHERTVQVPVTLIDRGTTQVLVSNTTPLAGGPPVTFSGAVDGGCDVPAFTWSSDDGQSGGGAQFTWTPPATECAPARQINVTATVTWPAGAPSTTQRVEVLTLQPWGAPFAPVFPAPASQPSGSSVLWAPVGPSHVCEGDGGYPGTTLRWDLIDGGGAMATPADGGLLVVAPQTCVPLQVTARARQEVLGEQFGRASDAGTLVVDVLPDTAPLGPTTPYGSTFEGDAGLVFGDATLTASCQAQRTLASEISVFNGASLLATQRFPAPGPWVVSVPGGCAGGIFNVVAELVEDGGLTGARAMGSVELPSTPARVGTLSASRVDVVCGQGARATLSVQPEPGACGTAEVSWAATGGPALLTPSGIGLDVDLQTTSLDFSTVGQQVALQLRADAGPGNVDVRTELVELGVQPFLELSVSTRPALRREEEPQTLLVSLHNPTRCEVADLSLLVPVQGGVPLPQTARLDGAPVAAAVTEAGLRVEGLRVAPAGTATLTLEVRPRLLGTASAAPVAELSGYPVSVPAPVTGSPAGCGCTSLEAPALWSLLLLALARRRRGVE